MSVGPFYTAPRAAAAIRGNAALDVEHGSLDDHVSTRSASVSRGKPAIATEADNCCLRYRHRFTGDELKSAARSCAAAIRSVATAVAAADELGKWDLCGAACHDRRTEIPTGLARTGAAGGGNDIAGTATASSAVRALTRETG